MADFSVEQKRIIDNYRFNNGLSSVLSYEAIVSIMEEKGDSVTLAKLREAEDKSLFGFGYGADCEMGLTIENEGNAPVLTQSEEYACNFLSDIVNNAIEVVEERDKEKGAISWCVNSWHTVLQDEYSKKYAKQQIKDTQNDLKYFERVANGDVTKFDYVTGENNYVTFQQAFKEKRGVEFNEENIQECAEKAQEFAAVKNATEMISAVKKKLAFTTKGDVNSQMHPEIASASIIEAFKLCGINSKEEINKTLKDISEKYKDNPQVKKYGGDFAIEKNKQGKYEITRRDKMGYRSAATNEELQIIARELGMRLDKEYANALGVDVPSNATAEDLAQITQDTFNRFQQEYEASFAKAYGKKDLKILAEKYVEKQQQGVANIEMAITMVSTAMMIVPAGAVATSGWFLKGALAYKAATGISKVDTAKKIVRVAQTLQKAQQVASPFIMGNMIITIASMEPVVILTQNSLNQSAWSTSLVKASSNRTYLNRKFGFIFDTDQANISAAYYANIGSGCEKGLSAFKNLLFSKGEERTYIKDRLVESLSKKGIELDPQEYSQLAKYLATKKYTTQLTKDIKINDKIIKKDVLVECLEDARDALFEDGNIHSEIVPINPRVKGLIAKVEKLEDCPEEFLKFAKKHNLPIILMRPHLEN